MHRIRIYLALTPVTRAAIWREKITLYRAESPGLTLQQRAALDRIEQYTSDTNRFDLERAARPSAQKELDALGKMVSASFGVEEAYLLIGTLGPAHNTVARNEKAAADCHCNVGSAVSGCSADFSWFCYSGSSCSPSSTGCGYLWLQRCNGICKKW
ncbi:bacteriocin fulvocin C-related protein [Streptomyces clavuligerus]|uniref:bacteriocin fulvocin C-related protein n=1 Tax=Streptomyces clavuligerus TaxID=1901 RepID=UPI00017FF9B0|nr:hypothetical protein SSCG_03562 [Streptomyces clavuligerus]MBY6307876.1 bacteriocin fulvocin C-related protein [Streptomyces clavuligerus]QPJ98378.1 bacteriocin fulvocin C-related protein [Streptomyces clavuligerus]WDN56293.1 bacteriocin fulvocin C-related protein [Streptomyces clavuligerus]